MGQSISSCIYLYLASSVIKKKQLQIDAIDLRSIELQDCLSPCIATFQLDIMVHNAGRSQRAHWKSIEIAVDREMFDLNVFSILSLSRMAVDHFLQTGSGHIVINSSLAGICPLPLSASYSGSKHALHVNVQIMYRYSGTKCENTETLFSVARWRHTLAH